MTDTPTEPARCTVTRVGQYDEIVVDGVSDGAIAIDYDGDGTSTPSIILTVGAEVEPVIASESDGRITYRIELPTE